MHIYRLFNVNKKKWRPKQCKTLTVTTPIYFHCDVSSPLFVL